MKHFLLSIVLFLIAISVFSQITLNTTIPTTNNQFYKMELQSGVEKFYMVDLDNYQIQLFNLDFSNYQTINIPNIPTSWNDYCIMYITDNLFDTDSKIEYIFWGEDTTQTYSIFRIYNEDGTLLLSADTSSMCHHPNDIGFEYADFIFNTYSGTKMALYNYDTDLIKIYDLSGTLQCDLCDASTIGSKQKIYKNNISLSTSYPNPASDYTSIDYNLPDGVKKGTISLYDLNGKVIKRYFVNDKSTSLRISTNKLSPGTYMYNLETKNMTSQGKKMLVIE